MSYRLGTVGFGYDDWAGPFYPPGLKAGDRLRYYAERFDTVELDATFHAAPDAERVRRWSSATPDSFRFSVKTPRAITHETPLDRAPAPMLSFLATLRGFGEKLSAVLLQFPPQLTADSLEKLDAFLAEMPGDVRLAVELRHRSWGTERTLEMLRARRCCFVSAEYSTRPRLLPATTDFLYVRWIGRHGKYACLGKEQDDLDENLHWWRETLAPLAEAGTGAGRDVFGYFNNDYAGYAVASCERFKRMLGLPIAPPPGGTQGTLFE